MACTPKPIRRQEKVVDAQMRKHQRRSPKAVVVLFDENWTMFNRYRNALLERMQRESRSSDRSERYRPAPAPVLQLPSDLPQGILNSPREQGNA